MVSEWSSDSDPCRSYFLLSTVAKALRKRAKDREAGGTEDAAHDSKWMTLGLRSKHLELLTTAISPCVEGSRRAAIVIDDEDEASEDKNDTGGWRAPKLLASEVQHKLEQTNSRQTAYLSALRRATESLKTIQRWQLGTFDSWMLDGHGNIVREAWPKTKETSIAQASPTAAAQPAMAALENVPGQAAQPMPKKPKVEPVEADRKSTPLIAASTSAPGQPALVPVPRPEPAPVVYFFDRPKIKQEQPQDPLPVKGTSGSQPATAAAQEPRVLATSNSKASKDILLAHPALNSSSSGREPRPDMSRGSITESHATGLNGGIDKFKAAEVSNMI